MQAETTRLGTTANVSDFLKPREAAELVRLDPRIIYRAISRQELRATKLGGSIRIHRSWLTDWIDRNTAQVAK